MTRWTAPPDTDVRNATKAQVEQAVADAGITAEQVEEADAAWARQRPKVYGVPPRAALLFQHDGDRLVAWMEKP